MLMPMGRNASEIIQPYRPPPQPTPGPRQNRYTLDPHEKHDDFHATMQKGSWAINTAGGEPPSLARTWKWNNQRTVETALSRTAYSGPNQPNWALHFGLNATRPTFGRLKPERSSHPAGPTLAGEMKMDQTVFSPFRTQTNEHVLTVGGTVSRQYSRSTVSSSMPSGHGLQSNSFASDSQDSIGHSGQRQPQPAASRSTLSNDGSITITRSCHSLDGISEKSVPLPHDWSHLAPSMKSETEARATVRA